MAIKAIEPTTVHRITSGQVVVDLQTAVKELVENSLDAGATNIEVRFKQYGLKSIEVIDNGCGIAEQDHDSIALKHHTSKLSSFADLTTVRTFGFRGEALSSLCALSDSVSVSTATEPPMGKLLEMAASGKVRKRMSIARQRGTTVTLINLFSPLPVRRKELERNVKREFGKALALLNAYALGPCCTSGNGVRLTVTNQGDKGQKTVQLRTSGVSSARAAMSVVWGPKALDSVVDLELTFEVEREKGVRRVLQGQSALPTEVDAVPVAVRGLISKFTVGSGRTGTDRQFFYVNGRPCNLPKIQKAFNEVYRSFNATQAPFILADFIIPTDSCDINVSPDKRTIFLHSEGNLIAKLKAALEETFAPARSTFDLTQTGTQTQRMTQSTLSTIASVKRKSVTQAPPTSKHHPENEEDDDEVQGQSSSQTLSSQINTDAGDPGQRDPAASQEMEMEEDMSMTVSQMLDARVGILGVGGSGGGNEDEKEKEDEKSEDDEQEDDMQIDLDAAATGTPRVCVSATANAEQRMSVTMDTSRAVWNRPAGLDFGVDEQKKDDEDEEEEEEEGPVRKKRKSESGSLMDKVSISVVKNTNTTKRKASSAPVRALAQDRMRSTLAGFARNGSQVSVVRHIEEQEEEEEQGEDEDEDEGEEEEVDQLADTQSSDIPNPSAEDNEPFPSSPIQPPSPSKHVPAQDIIDLTSEDGFDEPSIPPIFDVDNLPPSTLRREEPISRPEVIRSVEHGTDNGDVRLRFDVVGIAERWRCVALAGVDDGSAREEEKEVSTEKQRVPLAAGVTNTQDDERAVDALARVIEKSDFEKMEVVGQFNLGFIVVRRRKAVDGGEGGERSLGIMDDLFIVDQHAADEKYNFETLQATTNIKSQKLFRPQPLELTASDELIAVENIDVLRQNGFEVEESRSPDLGCGHGHGVEGARLNLTAQPVSKSTVFDMKDLEELVHLMRDRPAGQMVRCSKARAMFAMRACRKSVMVGMPLNRHQMASVVQHMGTMDQPWNCPHGRPTMRHLLDLAGVSSRRQVGKVDWSAFGG